MSPLPLSALLAIASVVVTAPAEPTQPNTAVPEVKDAAGDADPAPPGSTENSPAAEPADAPAAPGYLGQITGNNVYVRSGPSGNYYPVAKLQAGAHVRVLGREADWLAIVPPPGCFSLIADAYVDPGDGALGVVNGDNVRVRAGSLLDAEKRYAVQSKLDKGAQVEIVGHLDRTGNEQWGYYKIAPPPGTRAWVAAQYVERIPDGMVAAGDPGDAALTSAQGEGSEDTVEPPSAERTALVGDTPQDGTPPAAAAAMTPEEARVRAEGYRATLQQLDADLRTELAKPLAQRRLNNLIEGFTPLANQDVDDYTAAYAATRISQLRDMQDNIESVGHVRQLGEQVKVDRSTALAARATIRPPKLVPLESGYHIEGELRPSAIYSGGLGPQRYRLVDPSASVPRTIGYLEIPDDVNLNANDFLGRVVGVKAREVTVQPGGVDPIYVYVVEEMVVLDRTTG